MTNLIELDTNITFREQLGTETGPVVLANLFRLAPGDIESFVADVWTADAAFMRAQSGCLSVQLHRGVGPSGVLLNIAVWETAAQLGQAFGNPQFQVMLANYPDGVTISPHLFEKMAVPGICAG